MWRASRSEHKLFTNINASLSPLSHKNVCEYKDSEEEEMKS